MNQSKVIRSVSIVGAGNLGWHLARALSQKGIEIINVISRNIKHANEITAHTGGIPLTLNDNIIRHPDLYLISVRDEAIKGIIESLLIPSYSLIVHTSASTGIEIFQGKENYGVFYPLQTFTKNIEMDYSRIPFLIEGSNQESTERLFNLAVKISDNVQLADSDQRMKLHIAAVFACNFSNHMAVVAEKILEEAELDFGILIPLIEQTARKLKASKPLAAQTGPAVREDMTIVNRHIAALKDFKSIQKLYRLLSDDIIRYIKKEDD